MTVMMEQKAVVEWTAETEETVEMAEVAEVEETEEMMELESKWVPESIGTTTLDDFEEEFGDFEELMKLGKTPAKITLKRGDVYDCDRKSIEGQKARDRVDRALRIEAEIRRMEHMEKRRNELGKVVFRPSLLSSEVVKCLLRDDREVICRVGPMETSTWFLIDEIGEKPVWQQYGQTKEFLLGRLVSPAAAERLAEEAKEVAEMDYLRSRRVLPKRGATFFRAVDDTMNAATHILVCHKWTSTNGYLDRPQRPREAVFYETRQNNANGYETLNTMSWGRDYYILPLNSSIRGTYLGKKEFKKAVGGGY